VNDWEQHANLGLQSLGDAFQRGHIDRAEFRARRRRLLQGVRERHAQTQPNALHPQPAPVASHPPTAPHRARARKFVTVGTCAIIGLALLAWWWLRRGG